MRMRMSERVKKTKAYIPLKSYEELPLQSARKGIERSGSEFNIFGEDIKNNLFKKINERREINTKCQNCGYKKLFKFISNEKIQLICECEKKEEITLDQFIQTFIPCLEDEKNNQYDSHCWLCDADFSSSKTNSHGNHSCTRFEDILNEESFYNFEMIKTNMEYSIENQEEFKNGIKSWAENSKAQAEDKLKKFQNNEVDSLKVQEEIEAKEKELKTIEYNKKKKNDNFLIKIRELEEKLQKLKNEQQEFLKKSEEIKNESLKKIEQLKKKIPNYQDLKRKKEEVSKEVSKIEAAEKNFIESFNNIKKKNDDVMKFITFLYDRYKNSKTFTNLMNIKINSNITFRDKAVDNRNLLLTLNTVSGQILNDFRSYSGPQGKEEYQKLLCTSQLRKIHAVGASNIIISSVFIKSKNLICLSTVDGIIGVYNSKDYTLKYSFIPHNGLIPYISQGRNNIIISCSSDRLIKVWKIDNKENLLLTLTGHKAGVTKVVQYNEHYVSAGEDGSVLFWGSLDGDNYQVLNEQNGAVLELLVLSDGVTIISGAVEGKDGIVCLKGPSFTRKIKLDLNVSYSDSIIETSRFLIAASQKGIYFIDKQNFTIVSSIPNQKIFGDDLTNFCLCLKRIHPDFFLCGTRGGDIIGISSKTKKIHIVNKKYHGSAITSINKVSKRIITTSQDKSLSVGEITTEKF